MRRARPIPPHVLAAMFAAVALVGAPALRAQDSLRVPLAAHTLARGDTLGPSDILADSSTAAAAAGLVGMIARRVVRTGEPLRPPAIGRPPVIISGQTVTVRAAFGSVIVSRQGTAQSTAALGDSVRVRLDARSTITGIAGANATVTISRPH